MILDPLTQAIMTALVVVVAGVIFISETLLRRDDGAGKIWALAYLAAMLTTLSYLGWAATPALWWAVSVGNSMFVASAGLMWLGCCMFNGRLHPLSIGVVAAASLAAVLSVVVAGRDGGGWAGAEVMFIGIGVFSAAGAVETLRGEMRENLNARVLTIVLSIQAAFYAARTVVFVLFGSESEVFQQWFDTEVSSYFTVALTITALVTTSVLRTDRARLRARPSSSSAVYSSEQVLLEDSFRRIFEDWVRRAEVRRDPVVVTAVALEDLDTIATAFGEAAVVDVIDTWVAGVRRHSPASALIGEDGLGRLMVVSAMPSVDDAKGQALRIFHGLLDDAGMGDTVIRPAIGIGIALSATTGYDAEALLAGARAAAARATLSLESSVVVAI